MCTNLNAAILADEGVCGLKLFPSTLRFAQNLWVDAPKRLEVVMNGIIIVEELDIVRNSIVPPKYSAKKIQGQPGRIRNGGFSRRAHHLSKLGGGGRP